MMFARASLILASGDDPGQAVYTMGYPNNAAAKETAGTRTMGTKAAGRKFAALISVILSMLRQARFWQMDLPPTWERFPSVRTCLSDS